VDHRDRPWVANGGSITSDAEEVWEAHRFGVLYGRLHALYEMHTLLQCDPSQSASELLAAMRAVEAALRDRRRTVAYENVGRRLVHGGDAVAAKVDDVRSGECDMSRTPQEFVVA
jgi:hypothetical protein